MPLDVFPGLLVRVAVRGEPSSHLLHTPRINIRPDGDGYVLLHHDSIDGELTDDFAGAEDPLCTELLERAQRVLPVLEEAEIVEARFGMRPVPADGHSCVGRLSSFTRLLEAVTHSGVTLGPLVGRLLARPDRRSGPAHRAVQPGSVCGNVVIRTKPGTHSEAEHKRLSYIETLPEQDDRCPATSLSRYNAGGYGLAGSHTLRPGDPIRQAGRKGNAPFGRVLA